ETLVPRSVNSGMPTNWMPGAGRGCTPGSSGLAPAMASRVTSAKAAASSRYSGMSYVEARLPAGTLDQPAFSPTSFSYSLPEAQEMNFQALSAFLDAFWTPHAQVQSHPELSVFSTGAGT